MDRVRAAPARSARRAAVRVLPQPDEPLALLQPDAAQALRVGQLARAVSQLRGAARRRR
jgi:hypothetical protein